ncbi:MAG: zinc-binding alcohol dehydrogenase family protein [Nitrospirae bacterium]|nr:zinc-binding alcohol dehydrogenase family protein [Nitrospirota bacterium]MDA1303139.1 zinc-binding alcohol dehydrogenase family protein [Nitrospirota bacterium]
MTTATLQDTTHKSSQQTAPAKTMKAAVLRQFGDPEVLKYEEIDTPKPKPGHVLIKVLAAGLNRLDHYLREGSVMPDLPLPHILGVDAVGEVVELGEGVTGLNIGERVIPAAGFTLREEDDGNRPLAKSASFVVPGVHLWGSYAQYMEVPARWAVKDETGRSPAEVATLPVVLGTSVRAIKQVGEVKAGDTVLVTAGASGSGSMHIQVAKALGARVAATVRDDVKGEYVKSLGADLVINTRKENMVERVRAWTGGLGVDVAIDNVGGEELAKTIDAVRPFGIVVAYGFAAGAEATFNVRDFFFTQKQLRGTIFADPEDLQWGLEQVRLGTIKPALDRTFPLSQAAEAHRFLATNQVKGNFVLLPWAE